MSRGARWTVFAAFIIASSAGAVAMYAWTRAATRADHWQRGETKVQIHVPKGLPRTLYRAVTR